MKKEEKNKRSARKAKVWKLYGNYLCMESTYVWIMYGFLVCKKCMEWYGIDV